MERDRKELSVERDRKELSFAKLIAGAAWADGEVAPAEIEYVERLGTDLGLSGAELEEVRALLAQPIGIAEVQRLAEDLSARLSSDERAALLQHMEGLFNADARLDPGERRLLEEVRGAVEGGGDARSLLGSVRELLRGRHAEAADPEAAGVLHQVMARLSRPSKPGGQDARRFQQAVLFGSILYRVAYADSRLDDRELEQLRAILTGLLGFSGEESEQVIAAITERAAEDLDRQRLCASFNRVAEMEDRLKLLGCLFAVAKADGRLDDAELQEIRLIANYLWIDAREFHEVRRQYAAAGAQNGEEGRGAS